RRVTVERARPSWNAWATTARSWSGWVRWRPNMSGTVRRLVRAGNPIIGPGETGNFRTPISCPGAAIAARHLTDVAPINTIGRRGVEQRQLVGLITRRSAVRIRPPRPSHSPEPRVRPPGVHPFSGCPRARRCHRSADGPEPSKTLVPVAVSRPQDDLGLDRGGQT